MTNRRPQDPNTKRMPDPEADVPTFDPGATVLPDDLDPDKTSGPRAFEAPKPRAVRGGAAANPANTNPGTADPTLTANDLGALREQVRKKAATGVGMRPKAKRKGPGWAVWTVAFLLLGGVGFGVAWLVMNNPGSESGPPAAKAPKPDDTADAATASADSSASDAVAAADAGADAGSDAVAAADAGTDAVAAADAG
ncbi:MAG: hypothetical protein JNJ59_06540, partial [Deltaproteobacteria bacterium]|nr:hypothetical protein [Deltaproteobacteria bacterium]